MDEGEQRREHLRQAEYHLQAYHDQSLCRICREDVAPFIRGVHAVAEVHELTEEVVKKGTVNPAIAAGPKLAEDAEKLRAEALEEAAKVGVLRNPDAGATARQKKALVQVSGRTVIRETVALFRESTRTLPRPRRLLRGEIGEGQ